MKAMMNLEGFEIYSERCDSFNRTDKKSTKRVLEIIEQSEINSSNSLLFTLISVDILFTTTNACSYETNLRSFLILYDIIVSIAFLTT
jgi:hypothetical protein